MKEVAPIDLRQREQVIAETRAYICRGEGLFERSFEDIPILFDLKARASGMYKVVGKKRVIRFNPWLFSRYFEDCITNTVPHEVAHYLSDCVFGIRNIRPHGREWQQIMMAFGVPATVRSNFSLEGIPLRQSRTYPYCCGCGDHQLGRGRHSAIESGRRRYICRSCGENLVPVPGL